MRTSSILAVVALLALLLSGCAGKLNAQQGLSEEWRLRSLEENFLNFKENQRESEERGRDSQRKLLDRVRALEASVARLEQQGGGKISASPAPGPVAPRAAFPGTKPVVAEALAEAAASPRPVAPAPKPRPAAVVPPDKQLYAQGMNLVRQGKSAEGRKVLEDFLAKYPKNVLAPNAIYWIGESRYGEKNYAQAILTFKDVARRYPKHNKAAAALLKIAMSYRKMGENDNATLYLHALLREYPKSEPAPAARKMLAELGG